MNKNDLILELNSFKTAKRIYRDKAAKFVLQHPEIFPFLLELVFEDQKRINIKAAWILELVCDKNILFIIPYLEYFSQNLIKIKNESALRPIAKTCSFICSSYFTNDNKKIIKNLTPQNMQLLTECNFDWLIEDHKVATKVFAMETLLLLGKKMDWVHDELKLVLEKNISKESAGYLSRARKVLKELNS